MQFSSRRFIGWLGFVFLAGCDGAPDSDPPCSAEYPDAPDGAGEIVHVAAQCPEAGALGTAAAYAVSGNLQVTYGLVFGLINLVLAPVGLLLFRRLRLPTHGVLLLSLAMGVVGLVALAAWRLLPEMHLVAAAIKGRVLLPPDERFAMSRFCRGTY